jgi:LmbE family N-acetylglucosaminyl deacetylase
MVYSQEDVIKLGTILGIWAHPDDETWSCAGLMKMATLNGQKVGIITATKGDAGETADSLRWPKHKLAEIRMKEMVNCLSEIGDVEHYWLDYVDGKLAGSDEKEAVEQISELIKMFKPATVVTFELNGITGHDDHRTISRWTTLAVRQVDSSIQILHSVESQEKYDLAGEHLDREFNIFFNIEKPFLVKETEAEVVIKLDGDLLECKLCCMKAHASQTSKLFADINGRKMVEIMASTECYIFSK